MLFSLYINELTSTINQLGLGVSLGDEKLAIFLYADDIVLLALTEENLQTMLNSVDGWCKKFRMMVNNDKTNIIHFRQWNEPRSNFKFYSGEFVLQTVDKYKYLGCVLDEFLDFIIIIIIVGFIERKIDTNPLMRLSPKMEIQGQAWVDIQKRPPGYN